MEGLLLAQLANSGPIAERSVAPPSGIGVSRPRRSAEISLNRGDSMSYAALPSQQKIDIAASVRAAYTMVIDNARLAVDLAWLPFAILIGAEIVAWLVGGGGWFGMILALLVQAGGFAVFGTVFIVRWHRFILLGETTPESLFPPGWGTFFLTAVKIGLLAFVGVLVLVLIAAVPPHFLTVLIAIAGYIALAFAAARLSLVFPAAAIERPISLRQAWDLMAGNYWRLFACLLACYLPFGVVHYIVNEIGGRAPAILWIVFHAIRLAVPFAGLAVVASLMSDVYLWFYPTSLPT